MDDIDYEFSVVISPASPSRWEIEDELEEILEQQGLGEIVGAGAALDGSFCDMDMVVSDFDAGLRIIREVLQRYQVPESTIIYYFGPEVVKYPVYE